MDKSMIKRNMNKSKIGFVSLSPFAAFGVVLILVPLFVFMALDSVKEHAVRVEDKLTGKGLFLIRAFEAGTRNGMMTMSWGVQRVQRLLTETAYLPEVVYMMITAEDGRILAHSDPSLVGTTYQAMPELKESDPPDNVFHREAVQSNGVRVFEVYKRFTPARRRMGPMSVHMPGCKKAEEEGRDCPQSKGQGHLPDRPPVHLKGMIGLPGKDGIDWFRAHFYSGAPGNLPEEKQYIFAGLDMQQADAMKAQYLKHVFQTGAVLFIIGSAGIVSLFAFQGYRSAKLSLNRIKAFSDTIIETMPAGLVTTDKDLIITSANRAALDILGYPPDELSKPLGITLPPEMLQLVETLYNGPGMVSQEKICTSAFKGEILLDISVSPIQDDSKEISGYLFLFRDLSEIRALKTEIDRSRRLASVGKLAAGVAHEIRNPLSSIKGFATYFKGRYSDIPEDSYTADIMVREVERLNRSVSQLLEFAKPVPVVAKPVNIREIMDHSLKLIETDLAKKSITLEVSFNTHLESFLMDPDRLNQILLNLYLNACQAMDNHGTLRVNVNHAAGGRHIDITVSDTGKGIDKKDLDQIFDPYYTTRPDGAGLGLAMVHRAVEDLNGEITVKSTPGLGTSFKLKLPVQPA